MPTDHGHEFFRWTALLAFLLCYATIMLGGEVIATDAGLGCSTWPTCQPGSLLPHLGGATTIEFSHRLGALTLTIFVALLFVTALLFERRRPTLVRLASVSFALVLGEALLGGVVVDSRLDAALVVVHFAVATILLGLLALLVALVYLPILPRRWVEWARAAGAERPARLREPTPSPAVPTPSRPVPERPIGSGVPGPARGE
jgi:heme A synthase